MAQGKVARVPMGNSHGEFVVNGFEVIGQGLELSWLGAEDLVLDFFELEEPEFEDARAGAFVPNVEGGGWDVDLF